MSVRCICAIALLLANFTTIDGYNRIDCGWVDLRASLENIFLHDCRDVRHSDCTLCPAHWYLECPSGYVHKTYRSCNVFGCKLECVRDRKSCCEDCSTCPPRYYTQTSHPSPSPTPRPTRLPTRRPTNEPTEFPTIEPTPHPTDSPTDSPTETPTPAPTDAPSQFPTKSPSLVPTVSPTLPPTMTESPTLAPTFNPTSAPTIVPSMEPSVPSPEEVCAAISDKKTCKGTSGCHFGRKANGPCSLFRGVCEEIKNKKTCRNAEPCVFEFDRCRSKSFTTLSPTFNPTLVPSTSPTSAPSNSPTTVPSMSPSSVPSTSPSAASEDCITTCSFKLNEAGICHDSVSCRAEGAALCSSFGEENARRICEDDDNW